jgi:hypothetical protein
VESLNADPTPGGTMTCRAITSLAAAQVLNIVDGTATAAPATT